MSASWYDVLGVDPGASNAEIRDAWKTSIADLDPTDRRFALYNEAAGVLLDDDKRAAYDAERAGAATSAPPVAAPTEGPGSATGAPDEDSGDRGTARSAAGAGAVAGLRDRLRRRGRTRGTTTTEQTAAEPDSSGRPGRGPLRPLSTGLLVVLAVLVALTVGAAAWLQLTRVDAQAAEESLADAREAAEDSLPKVFTYDYRFPERDRDQAAGVLTGDLREDYESLWDDAIAPNLERTEGTATSEVVGSGEVRVSEDGDRAEVMVVLDSVTANARTSQELTLALTVTMVLVDGDWFIEEIDGFDLDAAGADPDEGSSEGPDEGSGDDAPAQSEDSSGPSGEPEESPAE